MLGGIGFFVLVSVFPLAAPADPVSDVPFVQEYHEAYRLHHAGKSHDVYAVAADREGQIWAGTKAGAYLLEKGEKRWKSAMHTEDEGPVFDLLVDRDGVVWAGAWNGLYKAVDAKFDRIETVDDPIAALCETEAGIVAVGPDGIWECRDSEFRRSDLPCAQSIRAALPGASGGYYIGTANGLFFRGMADRLYQSESDILTAEARGMTYGKDGTLWVVGNGGATLYRDGERTGHFKAGEGVLPTPSLQCAACDADGMIWIGTASGVVRYAGGKWSLRHGKRWLLSDDVRDICFDSEGTAWIATEQGVSAIRRKHMTLSDKAAHFHGVSLERHTREPWIVERCRLRTPGDVSSWEPEDDDNDGGYTAMYLAMESYRYAATQDEQARENAKKAFATLQLLQTVTETPGFFARTVVPKTWADKHDPGETFKPEEWVEERIRDPRYKKVPVRWRPSADERWMWKIDTSSDEVTAHFYGYGRYFDLAADDEEKEALRRHVSAIMDYIIDGGYVLKDIDGTHTRWGVWAPERLNHDPNWASERGVNSAEILSYLKTAYHITGNEKYQSEYLRLLRNEGYANNVRVAKSYGPAWRTHIDDELLALSYPALMRYESDEDLLKLYRESLERWYKGVKSDESPFFDFVYASLTSTSPSLAGVDFLRDTPLDLVAWTMDNSKREDIRLVREPEVELLQTSRLVPASERGVMRWDKNPWAAVQGEDGHSEWCPTFWLLPYWMARQYGYIQAPQ